MFKTNKNKYLEFAYLACLSVYFILSLTAFSPLGDRLTVFLSHKALFTITNWGAFAVLAVIYLLKDHENKKEIILELFIAALFAVVTYTNQTVTNKFQLTQWTFFYTTGMFIICATVTTFRRIALTTLATSLFMFAGFNFLAYKGLVVNFTIERFGTVGYFMGYYYYAHPSYYMLFAWLIYMYLRGEKKISWLELIAEFGAMYMLYKHTTCRLGFVCACVAFAVYVVIVKLELIKLEWKITRFASIAGYGLTAIFTLMCGYLYSKNNFVLSKINSALNGRFYLTKLAFERYDINLFGRIILPQGSEYFYLDSGYVYALFGCGLIFFLAVLFIHSYVLYYACKTKDKGLFVWLVTLMIFGIVGDAWAGITYSPTLLAFFILLRDRKNISESEKLK